jgi:hypothetical protein
MEAQAVSDWNTEDTDEAPELPLAPTGAGGPDRYPFGMAPASLTVITERVDPRYVCCGYASAQMAARTAKAGISDDLRREGHAIRSRGGRPHNAGSNAAELERGLQLALGVDVDPVEVAGIPARLQAGYAVIVALQYARLPEQLKVQGNDFGHAVTLYGWKAPDLVGFYDPLWPQDARGAWAKWADVRRALWTSGHRTTKTKATTPAPTPDRTLRYGGEPTGPRDLEVVVGTANVRSSPYVRSDNVTRTLRRGARFTAWQRTDEGTNVQGDRVWFGDRAGTSWISRTVVRWADLV